MNILRESGYVFACVRRSQLERREVNRNLVISINVFFDGFLRCPLGIVSFFYFHVAQKSLLTPDIDRKRASFMRRTGWCGWGYLFHSEWAYLEFRCKGKKMGLFHDGSSPACMPASRVNSEIGSHPPQQHADKRSSLGIDRTPPSTDRSLNIITPLLSL
jgi:hypothetical protein